MAGKDIVDGCQRPPLVGLPCIVLDQPLLHLTFALVAAATPSSPSCCYGYWSSPPSPLTSARCSLCNASLNEPQPQGPPQPATAASSVNLSSHPTVGLCPRKPELRPGPGSRLHISATPGTSLGSSSFWLTKCLQTGEYGHIFFFAACIRVRIGVPPSITKEILVCIISSTQTSMN